MDTFDESVKQDQVTQSGLNRRTWLQKAVLGTLGVAGLAVLAPHEAAAQALRFATKATGLGSGSPSVVPVTTLVARYTTQIGFGSTWQNDTDLLILIQNRNAVVPAAGLPAVGTTVSWASTNGNASITFFDNADSFTGSAQFPGEGPVSYRGQFVQAISSTAAKYKTQIGFGSTWQADTPLRILIQNRNAVVPGASLPAVGTMVSWSSTNGNASITFFDNATNAFNGSAQFPGEGPVAYRSHP